MRAIYIDAESRTVMVAHIEGDLLPALYGLLNCSLVEAVRIGDDLDMWIDEEGRLSYPNPTGYFRFRNGGPIWCGSGVITGGPDAEGNTTRAPFWLTAEMVADNVEWLDTPSREEVEPQCFVMMAD